MNKTKKRLLALPLILMFKLSAKVTNNERRQMVLFCMMIALWAIMPINILTGAIWVHPLFLVTSIWLLVGMITVLKEGKAGS